MRSGWMAAAAVAALTLGTMATIAATTSGHSLGPTPVVVELFTSQG